MLSIPIPANQRAIYNSLKNDHRPLRSVHTRYKLQQRVAATNRFVCAGEFLWKFLSPQHNFVAATSRKKSNHTEFVRLVAATKFCCIDKDFYKNSPVHTKRFVAATCRRNVLLQLVAGPVHLDWSVAATCCCNFSPSVYRPLKLCCSIYLLVHWETHIGKSENRDRDYYHNEVTLCCFYRMIAIFNLNSTGMYVCM